MSVKLLLLFCPFLASDCISVFNNDSSSKNFSWNTLNRNLVILIHTIPICHLVSCLTLFELLPTVWHPEQISVSVADLHSSSIKSKSIPEIRWYVLFSFFFGNSFNWEFFFNPCHFFFKHSFEKSNNITKDHSLYVYSFSNVSLQQFHCSLTS